MQMGQSKFGMKTLNQSLADLYFRKLITLETAMDASSKCEELTDIIQRREGGDHPQSPNMVTNRQNFQRRK